MDITAKEKQVLRGLAQQLAEIAHSPAQRETIRLWRKLNARRMERPMVVINQLPWNELSAGDDSLTTVACDPFWKNIELEMRRTLYQYEKFPVDMVVNPWITLPKAIHNTGFGIETKQEISILNENSDVSGKKYFNQMQTEEDIQKIQAPIISHDEAATAERYAMGADIFNGILPVRMEGVVSAFNHWDVLVKWLPTENLLYDMMDRPDFVHALMRRYTDAHADMIDQIDKLGLFSGCTPMTHCSPTFGDDPLMPLNRDDGIHAGDVWTHAMAQVFANVSPAAHKEFELDYVIPVLRRFAAVYYGCCEPLHDRMRLVREIPNLRKVSCSPWIQMEPACEILGADVIASRKPSPALLATDCFDPQAVDKEFAHTMQACRRNNTPLEFILKDVSTVRNQPNRLTEWAQAAMRAVCT